MANIKPVFVLRPNSDIVAKVAALPYDVYNREEATEVVKKNELSFLAIDRGETSFGNDVGTYDDVVYQKAKEILEKRIEEKIYEEADDEYYYVYELIMDGRSQSGIVAAASVDDYYNNIIKKHENTKTEKENDRIMHIRTLKAQTGPIFLAYKEDKAISEIVEKYKKGEPLYDFISDDGITHRVYVIKEKKDIEEITERFHNINSVYIADGHHRAASGAKIAKENGEKYLLSVLFPDNELKIYPYNRVVKDLNGNTKEEFFDKLSKNYNVEEVNESYIPKVKGEVGLYIDNTWYKCSYKGKEKVLDVDVLQRYVLDEILGIKDPKTDKRIDFVGGIRGNLELEKRCESDMKLAFSMYPTSIKELFEVADNDELMPPKSTWFEPKLRSGIFIRRI